jgi:glycosyltransferase involved in cell wall biosynthesis
MNILIFSHSSSLGGAERALLTLIIELRKNYKISVIVPSLEGELVKVLNKMNIECLPIPFSNSLPIPTNTILQFQNPNNNLDYIENEIRSRNFDLIISNTIVTLFGMLLAKKLNLPCITYAHEYLIKDEDLYPRGCSARFYLNLISEFSNHILCASKYVASSFLNQKKTSILYPFDHFPTLEQSDCLDTDTEYSILVIGTFSRRKNTHFALTVFKALRLRGLNVNLHLIGSDNTGSYKLRQQLNIRNEVGIKLHTYLKDPFAITGKKINLVCSHCEPFGLTIPESLARGIPTIASKAGGPEEILCEELTYEVDDINGCVRIIEKVIADYDFFVNFSRKIYDQFSKLNMPVHRSGLISEAIISSFDNFNKENCQNSYIDLKDFTQIFVPPITLNQVINNIASVAKTFDPSISELKIRDLVATEIKSPGTSVMSDFRRFDIVPFGYSKNMDNFYKYGLGQAIELAANFKDTDKQSILGYILLRIQELKLEIPNPRILCLGDRLGIDSIILASCGLYVDYMGLDQSFIKKCAGLNIASALKNSERKINLNNVVKPIPPYDVIIALDFIQNDPNPNYLLEYFSQLLGPQGVLFISENFDGVYDETPTHLYLNEKFSFKLPIIASPFFKFESMNSTPLGKPYVLIKKSTQPYGHKKIEYFDDNIYVAAMLNSFLKIGF